MDHKLAMPLLLGVVLTACNGQPVPPAFDAKTFMATRVQPAADRYWKSVQYISDAEGLHKIEPKTDADWASVQNAAKDLAGYAKQLAGPAASHGRGTDWADYAKGLGDVAILAEKAASDRSPDRVFGVGQTLYNVCSACHEVYMPTPGGAVPPPAETETPGGS